MAEYKMNIASSSKTFVHANGKDCSNIDYFMFRKSPTLSLHDITCLNTIGGNTSDHFPVRCEINSMLESLEDTQRDDDADSDRSVCISRINWSKVDKQQYLSTVEDKLGDLTLHISNKQALEQSIISVQTVMRDAATASGGISSRRKPRYLRSVTPVVKEAKRRNKQAHFVYKQKVAEGTLSSEHILKRKQAKTHLRSLMRRQDAAHHAKMRSQIMLARREDSKLFHKLVRSQRGNSRAPLPQLDVKDVTFRGEDNIRAGWKTHFQTLASASSNHKFDEPYKNIVDSDVDVIKDIYMDAPEPVAGTTVEEVAEAVKSLNKGKRQTSMELLQKTSYTEAIF